MMAGVESCTSQQINSENKVRPIAMESRTGKVFLTIKEQVYQVIKENIINERLKPGERIQELQIAKELNVSRSPVRSAINELIGEGLLESIPNKSVTVRRLSEKEILDTYEFRVLLERFAIEKLSTNMTSETDRVLADFKQQFMENSGYEHLLSYVEIDNRFHTFLIETAGNEMISETLHRISTLVTPFRVISLKSRKRFTESVEEHIGMIDAIRAGNADLAVRCCEIHLTLAKNEIVSYLRNTPSPSD
jgi:DNA-binding GntR family transcriptional regulator